MFNDMQLKKEHAILPKHVTVCSAARFAVSCGPLLATTALKPPCPTHLAELRVVRRSCPRGSSPVAAKLRSQVANTKAAAVSTLLCISQDLTEGLFVVGGLSRTHLAALARASPSRWRVQCGVRRAVAEQHGIAVAGLTISPCHDCFQLACQPNLLQVTPADEVGSYLLHVLATRHDAGFEGCQLK
ncbi:unnamed protein product [Polarella glacialis]|uniref:Uncharacterized protein n=1 Tax=Polarella glacialis TaxID=89957 RepID=A0A813FR49_POLGL|nr:unnamed protein product [Polarella glacialis]